MTTDATMKTPPTERHSEFLKSLVEFTHDHRAARWSGTLSDFLESVFRNDPKGMVRTSHQYTWDMLRANGFDEGFSAGFSDSNKGRLRCQLFEDELFGIDDTISRVLDYLPLFGSDGKEVTGKRDHFSSTVRYAISRHCFQLEYRSPTRLMLMTGVQLGLGRLH